MKRLKRALPIASTAILLAAGSTFEPTAAQAGSTYASPPASESSATTTPLDVSGTEATSAGFIGWGTGASTPADLLQLLGERIEAQDLDGIIALHEPEAAIVHYDGSVIRGHEDIRTFYDEWFESDPVLTVSPMQTVVAGGWRGWDGEVRGRTAAIMGHYTLEQTGPDGTRVTFSGEFCDTVREQLDGTWQYILDDPYPPHGS